MERLLVADESAIKSVVPFDAVASLLPYRLLPKARLRRAAESTARDSPPSLPSTVSAILRDIRTSC